MASPLDATTLQRLVAAEMEFEHLQNTIASRLVDTRFKLVTESAEALREAISNVRTAVNRIRELGNIIGQPNFNTDDRDHLEHVLEEVNEPNEDLDLALTKLTTPEVSDMVTRAEGFAIWFAEWQLALTRYRRVAYTVLEQGRAIQLILTRRQA